MTSYVNCKNPNLDSRTTVTGCTITRTISGYGVCKEYADCNGSYLVHFCKTPAGIRETFNYGQQFQELTFDTYEKAKEYADKHEAQVYTWILETFKRSSQ